MLNSLFECFISPGKEDFVMKTFTEHSRKLCTLYDRFTNNRGFCERTYTLSEILKEYPKTTYKLCEVLHGKELKDLYPYCTETFFGNSCAQPLAER